jgi:hypothetical protein
MGREESGGIEGSRAVGDLQAAPATEGVYAYDIGLMLVPGASPAIHCTRPSQTPSEVGRETQG